MHRSQIRQLGAATRLQSGVMLLEILVSILIFSFGVLALVGLQGSMTRAQTEAELRAEASFLAGEVIGLMWTSAATLSSYAGNNCDSTDPCVTWREKVAEKLPAGQGTIAVNGNTVTVTITWRHSGGDQRTYTTTTDIVPA
jgi:type IV pilus assembly protein PilV